MADIMPNAKLARLKDEYHLAELELSLKRLAVSRAQMAEEAERVDATERATILDIEALRAKLAAKE